MTTPETLPDLKPCPHCGAEAHYTSRSNGDEYSGWQNPVDHWVFCDADDCLTHYGMAETREEAIAGWNRRADTRPAPAVEGLLEALRELDARCSEVGMQWGDEFKPRREWEDCVQQAIHRMREAQDAARAAIAAYEGSRK